MIREMFRNASLFSLNTVRVYAHTTDPDHRVQVIPGRPAEVELVHLYNESIVGLLQHQNEDLNARNDFSRVLSCVVCPLDMLSGCAPVPDCSWKGGS